jgi:hypothetical protein
MTGFAEAIDAATANERSPLLVDTVRQVIHDRVGMFPTDNVRVEPSKLGEQAGIIGAIALAREPIGGVG